MHSGSGDYTYRAPEPVTPSYQQPVPKGAPVLPMAPGPSLRQFDLRPLPERFDTWCTSLERRLEDAERRLADAELLIHRLLNADDGQP